jgi:hypothetical protein
LGWRRELAIPRCQAVLESANNQINHNNANNEKKRINYFSEFPNSFNDNNENNSAVMFFFVQPGARGEGWWLFLHQPGA